MFLPFEASLGKSFQSLTINYTWYKKKLLSILILMNGTTCIIMIYICWHAVSVDYAREIYYFLSGEVSIWIKSFNELNVFPWWNLQDLYRSTTQNTQNWAWQLQCNVVHIFLFLYYGHTERVITHTAKSKPYWPLCALCNKES